MILAPFTLKSLTKLQQEQSALFEEADQVQGLIAETEDEAEREKLNEQFSAIIDRADSLQEDIDRAQKLVDRVQGKDAARDDKKAPVQLDDADSSSSDNIKVKIPATAIRTPVRSFLKDKIYGMDPNHRAYAFGRYLLACAARTSPGQYHHLQKHVQAHEEAFGPMNAATEGGNAGIWVPTQFGEDLTSLLQSYGRARQLADVKTMTSDKRTDPIEGSIPTVSFVGEGTSGTDATPTDDRTSTLTARKLMCILIYSSELNEDAIMEFGDSMLRRMANAFARTEDRCMWLGDGTSTFGNMLGINYRLQTDISSAAGLVTGTTGSGAAWSSFTLTDFEKVVATQPDYATSSEDANVWVTHKQFYYEVMVRLMLASGGVTAAEVGAGRNTPIFLGYPVIFSNALSNSVAVSTVYATFGDHARAVSFGDRRAYTVDFSQQASVGSVDLWSSDQIGIKATERFDIQAHSLGDGTTAGPVIALESAAS